MSERYDRTILWQSRAPMVHACYRNGALDRRANGGNAYDYFAMRALARAFSLRLDGESARRPDESALGYWWRLQGHRATADLVIKEPALVGLGRIGDAPAEIGVIHHLSFEIQDKSPAHRVFFSRLARRLPRLKAVVTVSSYWRERLEQLGCRNVEVIYNSFDPRDFELSVQEVDDFRRRNGIPDDRPLVYIGNGGAQKGVYDVFEALKDEGYTLVTTGASKPDLPVRWFNLDRRDYLRLLTACDVAISMSRLPEGWCRVVHEAMLCRTPVIGSGSGGMRELLEGGGQIVLRDIHRLRDTVRGVLRAGQVRRETGYAYACRFDTEYFERSWVDLARRVLASERKQRLWFMPARPAQPAARL